MTIYNKSNDEFIHHEEIPFPFLILIMVALVVFFMLWSTIGKGNGCF